MGGSAWKRGIIGGALAALIVILLPNDWLEPVGAALGVGLVILQTLLVIAAFVAGYALGASLFRRSDLEFDTRDDAPLAASQPRVAATPLPPAPTELDERLARIEKQLATLPAQTTKAIKACPSADLDRTLRSIQRALRKPHSDPVLVEAVHSLQTEGSAGLVSRIEALETHINERLAGIEARLAGSHSRDSAPLPLLTRVTMRRPAGLAPKRISQAVADIRNTIDRLPH